MRIIICDDDLLIIEKLQKYLFQPSASEMSRNYFFFQW